jgi:D-aspartate ligase
VLPSTLLPALILKTSAYPLSHQGLGVIRSLGNLGVPVYTVIEDRFAPAALSRYLKGKFVWDFRQLTRTQLLELLTDVGEQLNGPTVLIPTDDFAATLIAQEAMALRKWFLFPKVPPFLPNALANKRLLYELCRQMQIPCPRSLFPNSIFEVHEFAQRATFPLVVKSASAWLRPGGTPSVSIVSSPKELVHAYRQAQNGQVPNVLIQEYIVDGEDWFFHGYCNESSECLVAFTGRKLRSYPPHAGFTTLGVSETNTTLAHQAQRIFKAISYAGIMDLDVRLDPRDGQYKLLDFNPRIGAQFRLFDDAAGTDVVRALYLDLTGQPVQKSKQIDGRVFIVETYDLFSSWKSFRRGELGLREWWRSFKGKREYAWFKYNDPIPFLMVWLRLLIRRGMKKSSVARH